MSRVHVSRHKRRQFVARRESALSPKRFVIEMRHKDRDDTWVHSRGWTKECAEELAAKMQAREPDFLYSIREGTEEELTPDFGELVDGALEKAKKETMDDARARCEVPAWAFDKCIELQEQALDELELEMENDKTLYEHGPKASTYNQTVRNVIEFSRYWVDKAFRPKAEEEVRKMAEVRISESDPEERREQLAQEIAERLMIPIVEQFSEIPREQRKAAVDGSMKAIRRALLDYTDSLKASWPRRAYG